MFATSRCIERNRALRAHMADAVRPLRDHPHVAEVRQTGMILAIEMVRDTPHARAVRTGRSGAACASTGTRSSAASLLRPLGNVIYFMPPYVITPEEIELLFDRAWPKASRSHVRLTRVFVDAPLAAGARIDAARRGRAIT